MKSFNLEEAKAGKSVRTREGNKVDLLVFDMKSEMPVGGVEHRNTSDVLQSYTQEGRVTIGGYEHPCDLMMVSEKKEGWINIYLECSSSRFERRATYIFQNRTEALEEANEHLGCYMTTIHIEWEE
jgi:hypothetical protein